VEWDVRVNKERSNGVSNLKGEGGFRFQGRRASGERAIGVVKEYKVEERKCPKCGSGGMRRSQMRGFWEQVVLRTIGAKAYRCERCDHRYYQFRPGEAKHKKSEE
jgi:DNA-directed RNA polymerase subunit RPC12/RpoP